MVILTTHQLEGIPYQASVSLIGVEQVLAPVLGIFPVVPERTNYLEFDGPLLSKLKIGCSACSRGEPLVLQAVGDFLDELRFSKRSYSRREILVYRIFIIEFLEGVSHVLDEFRELHD